MKRTIVFVAVTMFVASHHHHPLTNPDRMSG